MSYSLLHSPLEEIEFTSIDLETSGLYPKESEILEIAALRFNKDQILSSFSSFIKPEKTIPPEVTAIHGLTSTMLKDSPSLPDILRDFFDFTSNSILIIQNASFDLSFLLFKKNVPFDFLELPVFCTVQLSRKVFPEFQKHNLVSLRKNLKIGNYRKRTEASSHLHEAIDDSYAAMEVFKKCLLKNNGWNKKFEQIVHHEKGFKLVKDYRK